MAASHFSACGTTGSFLDSAAKVEAKVHPGRAEAKDLDDEGEADGLDQGYY